MNMVKVSVWGLILVLVFAAVPLSMAATPAERAAAAANAATVIANTSAGQCSAAGVTLEPLLAAVTDATAKLATAEKSGKSDDVKAAKRVLKKAVNSLKDAEKLKDRICDNAKQVQADATAAKAAADRAAKATKPGDAEAAAATAEKLLKDAQGLADKDKKLSEDLAGLTKPAAPTTTTVTTVTTTTTSSTSTTVFGTTTTTTTQPGTPPTPTPTGAR